MCYIKILVRKGDVVLPMFWIGLIVGLFSGAFWGFLFAAILAVGNRAGSEETAWGLSGTGKKHVSIELVPKQIGNIVDTSNLFITL